MWLSLWDHYYALIEDSLIKGVQKINIPVNGNTTVGKKNKIENLYTLNNFI